MVMAPRAAHLLPYTAVAIILAVVIGPNYFFFDPRVVPRGRYGMIHVEGFDQNPGPGGVDIILVHGLGGNPETTWRAPKPAGLLHARQKPSSIAQHDNYTYWIHDFLLEDVPPTVRQDMRVFQYNHDSSWSYEAHQTALSGLGNSLLHDVADLLANTSCTRTLVFVGSSYGGLIVKQALVYAIARSDFRHIVEQTAGVMFLGTPHQGSNLASWGYLVARTLRAHGSNIEILEELPLDSARLKDLHHDFVASLQDKLIVVNIYETRPAVWYIWLIPIRVMIVSERSATYAGPPARVINRAFAVDHFHLNKFAIRTYEYRVLLSQLLKMFKALTPEVFSVPTELVPTFTKRPRLLDKIDHTLAQAVSTGEALQSIVLHGLGGGGKSQLARYTVEQWCKDYRTIFWVDAENTASIRSSFARFAAQLGLQANENHSTEFSLATCPIIKDVLRWFSQHTGPNQRWMIVLDGADDLSRSEIEATLPRASSGTLLLTSRNPHTCSMLITTSSCIDIHVGVMEPDESSSILLRRLNVDLKSASSEVSDLATAVGNTLGHLPLAVDLAGAYIVEQPFDNETHALAMYLSDFQRHRDYLLKRKPFIELSSYELTVWTVWDRSLDAIKLKHPSIPAAQLLTFLSAFDGSSIQDELFRLASKAFAQVAPPTDAGYDESPVWLREWLDSDGAHWASIYLRESQSLLLRYSLIQRVAGRWPGLRVHNLVQWRSRQSENKTFWADWSTIFMLAAIYQSLSEDLEDHIDHEMRAAILSHFSAIDKTFNGVLDLVGRRADLWTAHLFEIMAEFMLLNGKWDASVSMFQQAMLIRQRLQGLQHPDSWKTLSRLGAAVHMKGDWQEALHYQEAAMMLHVHYSGTNKRDSLDHPDSLETFPDRQPSLDKQVNQQKALEHEKGALQLQLSELDTADEKVLLAMSDLASSYEALGRAAESEPILLQHLRIRLANEGEESPLTARSMNSLACTYLALGKPEKARNLLVKAVQIHKRHGEAVSKGAVSAMANLASAYAQLKQWKEAQAMYEESLKAQIKLLGEKHHDTLTTVSNLAYLHKSLNHVDDAEAAFKYLFKTRLEVHGPHHPDTLDSVANIAYYLYVGGHEEEGIRKLEECASMAKEHLGPTHAFTIKYEAQLHVWQTTETFWEATVHVFKIVHAFLWEVARLPLRMRRSVVGYFRPPSDDQDLRKSVSLVN